MHPDEQDRRRRMEYPAMGSTMMMIPDGQRKTNIERPTNHDVLCGRGVTTNRHPGNENFRKVVSVNKEQYVSSTKRQKMGISRNIVDAIHNLDPPGRFLEKDPRTGLWNEVSHKKAIEKTSQALRDGAAHLRKQLSADLGNPTSLQDVFDEDDKQTETDSKGSAKDGAAKKPAATPKDKTTDKPKTPKSKMQAKKDLKRNTKQIPCSAAVGKSKMQRRHRGWEPASPRHTKSADFSPGLSPRPPPPSPRSPMSWGPRYAPYEGQSPRPVLPTSSRSAPPQSPSPYDAPQYDAPPSSPYYNSYNAPPTPTHGTPPDYHHYHHHHHHHHHPGHPHQQPQKHQQHQQHHPHHSPHSRSHENSHQYHSQPYPNLHPHHAHHRQPSESSHMPPPSPSRHPHPHAQPHPHSHSHSYPPSYPHPHHGHHRDHSPTDHSSHSAHSGHHPPHHGHHHSHPAHVPSSHEYADDESIPPPPPTPQSQPHSSHSHWGHGTAISYTHRSSGSVASSPARFGGSRHDHHGEPLESVELTLSPASLPSRSPQSSEHAPASAPPPSRTNMHVPSRHHSSTSPHKYATYSRTIDWSPRHMHTPGPRRIRYSYSEEQRPATWAGMRPQRSYSMDGDDGAHNSSLTVPALGGESLSPPSSGVPRVPLAPRSRGRNFRSDMPPRPPSSVSSSTSTPMPLDFTPPRAPTRSRSSSHSCTTGMYSMYGNRNTVHRTDSYKSTMDKEDEKKTGEESDSRGAPRRSKVTRASPNDVKVMELSPKTGVSGMADNSAADTPMTDGGNAKQLEDSDHDAPRSFQDSFFIREKDGGIEIDFGDDGPLAETVDDISMSPLHITFDREDPTTLMCLPEDIMQMPISPCGPDEEPFEEPPTHQQRLQKKGSQDEEDGIGEDQKSRVKLEQEYEDDITNGHVSCMSCV